MSPNRLTPHADGAAALAARAFRRTKIVVTIGPATQSIDATRKMIEAGADVVRLNLSHGTLGAHRESIAIIRRAAREAGRDVAILADLPGPKVRLGPLPDGPFVLESGAVVRLAGSPTRPRAGVLAVDLERFASRARAGSHILLADGKVRLRVRAVTGGEVECDVLAGGSVSSNQGVNFPDGAVDLPAVGQRDLSLVDFAVEQQVDLIAVSFVKSPSDVTTVADRLRTHGARIPVVAKIERAEAVEAAAEIARVSAAIMIARGDLGVEVSAERVPVLRRRLLSLAGTLATPAITATQMLASMVDSPRPTRAEISDVATAIYEGSDAVMLSEETAVGAFPTEAIEVLDRVAREAERDLPYEQWALSRVDPDPSSVVGPIARVVVGAASILPLAALVVPTNSGRTVRLISAHRPRAPLIAVTPSPAIARGMAVMFGVRAVSHPGAGALEDLVCNCGQVAREAGLASAGDLIGVALGYPGQTLGTNTFGVFRVP